ncbi:hypothetical protein JIG36_44755 [Actinoplanes sp. LDG1-06]|uniref:Uncharacterized protein n=1 Tax=Paractinoplanes ovalisporus TaxID=2810368 RepID=A0ABS2ARY2_9ACTN|nr:hypothetical protein [Actinoplanes ovalisporus]MBM2622635.1 hypothetical protein [Actinoplanes ovalisporus]
MTSAETIDPIPVRPGVVTIAFWFQVALVALMLIVVGVSIADAVHYSGLIDEAVRTTTADTTSVSWEREDNVIGTLFLAVPLTVLAIWLGVTAVWVRRGSNVARILTWVGLGLPALFVVISCFFGFMAVFAFAALAAPFSEPLPEDDPTTWEDDPGFGDDGFAESVWDLDSGTWSVVSDAIIATSLVLILLLAVATVVLLLTGPANRWFRRGEPTRRPPTPQQFAFPYGYQPVPTYPAPYGYAAPPPHGYAAPPTWPTPYPPAGAPFPPAGFAPPAPPFPPAAAAPFPQATPPFTPYGSTPFPPSWPAQAPTPAPPAQEPTPAPVPFPDPAPGQANSPAPASTPFPDPSPGHAERPAPASSPDPAPGPSPEPGPGSTPEPGPTPPPSDPTT